MEADLLAGCSNDLDVLKHRREESSERDRGDDMLLPEPRNRSGSSRSLLAKPSLKYVALNSEETNRKLLEENTRLRAELTQATRRWLLLQNKAKYLQDNYDTFFKLRTEYQEIMEQSPPTPRPARVNSGTQTWDTLICATCMQSQAWMDSPVIRELRRHEADTVAIITKHDLLRMQYGIQQMQQRFMEHEQTYERRMDVEEIRRLRHRRTLLEAKLRSAYREQRAAKENLKILQMIIIKLERHRRAVMEAAKLDALLPSTCLSNVITDDEQWIVRRIVARFVSKATKHELSKPSDQNIISPPSSVSSQHTTDFDSGLNTRNMSNMAISQSSLIYGPRNDMSVLSMDSVDSVEAERRYALAELMAVEEATRESKPTTSCSNHRIIPLKKSSTSIHILLPAGSSMRITDNESRFMKEPSPSAPPCEIVYVSPVCTPQRQHSETVVKETTSKVEFTPITSAHLLFHTEEGIKKVNPFLEALKKISSDLAKFALPMMRYNEAPEEKRPLEVPADTTTANKVGSKISICTKKSSELQVVYLSPITSPPQGSSTSLQPGDTTSGMIDQQDSLEEIVTPEEDSEKNSSDVDAAPAYPILKALRKISDNLEFYSNTSVDRIYPRRSTSSSDYIKQTSGNDDYYTSDSVESSIRTSSNRTTSSSIRTSTTNSENYPYKPLKSTYRAVVDIPLSSESDSLEDPKDDEPNLKVLSQSIIRNLGARSREGSARTQYPGNRNFELDRSPGKFFDRYAD